MMAAKHTKSGKLKLTATSNGHIDLGDYLDDKVYPALFERLDTAFPEFTFRRKGDDWIATSWPSDFPATAEHKRPDRLMVYRDHPYWIKLHGHEGVRFLDLANGGRKPRGEEFREAERKLCQRAGVPFPEKETTNEQAEHARRLDARPAVLEDGVAICEEHL